MLDDMFSSHANITEYDVYHMFEYPQMQRRKCEAEMESDKRFPQKPTLGLDTRSHSCVTQNHLHVKRL